MSPVRPATEQSERSPDALDRWGPRLLAIVAAGAVAARLWLVFHRLYDPDELEHLHAGFCVWQGMVPYRDFFDQHGPVLWYLSLPLFAMWGASLEVLFAGRVIVWLLGAATIALTWHVGRLLHDRWTGAIAAVLLVTLPAFQEKNVEWRPDNVAVPLLLLSVLWLGRAGFSRGWLWTGLAGAALAAAFVCTQKVAYVGVGIVAGFVWMVWTVPDAKPWRCLLGLSAGAAIVAAIVLLFFSAQGAMFDYVRLTVLLPLRWKTHEPIARYLALTLAAAPVFWAAGAVGFFQALARCRQRATLGRPEPVIACGAAAHVLGIFVVPAAFHQYYLPLAPLAALLGAQALVGTRRAMDRPDRADSRGSLLNRLAVPVAAVVWMIGIACRTGPAWLQALIGRGAWRPLEAVLTEVGEFLRVAVGVASTGVLVAGGLAGVVLSCFRDRRYAALLVLVAGVAGAAPFLVLQFRWSHRGQRRAIEQLMSATTPEDRFFDGYTGCGALRPHAFRYFWINHHSWPLVPESERVDGVLRALQDPRTRVVLFDGYLRDLLPLAVQRVVVRDFIPDPRYRAPGCVVLVKRGRELPDVPN